MVYIFEGGLNFAFTQLNQKFSDDREGQPEFDQPTEREQKDKNGSIKFR